MKKLSLLFLLPPLMAVAIGPESGTVTLDAARVGDCTGALSLDWSMDQTFDKPELTALLTSECAVPAGSRVLAQVSDGQRSRWFAVAGDGQPTRRGWGSALCSLDGECDAPTAAQDLWANGRVVDVRVESHSR